MTRSLRRRLARRRVWWQVPIVSPYADRLMRRANGPHICYLWPVRLDDGRS